MFLDSTRVPEINRLLLLGQPAAVDKLASAEISLTVSLFLALAHRTLALSGNVEMARAIARLNLPGVKRGIQCLEDDGPQLSAEPFGAPQFDLYRIGSKDDLLSDEWSLFYDRFRRSASNER